MPLIGTLASDTPDYVEQKRLFDEHYHLLWIEGQKSLNNVEGNAREAERLERLGKPGAYQSLLELFKSLLNLETITADRWWMTVPLARGLSSDSLIYRSATNDRMWSEKYLPWEESAAPCLNS